MVTVQQIRPSATELLKLIRLHALKESPAAFGSTYANESQLSEKEWRQRAEWWNGDQAIGYFALDGASPCGIVGCFLDEDKPTTAHLTSMWVAPIRRRCGVGRLLVEHVIDWARSRGVETLHLMVTSSNDAAIRFYESMGFAMTGRTEPYPNGPGLCEYEMVRSLFCRNAAIHPR
jgi:ribosomal protein S18 acetylase RimI-like enzyme